MNRSFKIIALGWIALITAVLLTSCGDTPPSRTGANEGMKDPKEKAEEQNDAKFSQNDREKDAQYVVDAYSDGLCEIESAKQAVQYAGDQSVKDFASSMISAHVNMNSDLEKLAGKKQISVPKSLTEDKLDEIKKYQEHKGKEYSKIYLEKSIAKHKDAIALYEKAAEKASDPEIRNFFSSSLAELREHIDMATNLKDRLK